MTWLLTEEVARTMQRAERDGLAPTAEQQTAFVARMQRDGRANVQVADRVAVIDVVGVLTPAPNMLASLFGGGNTTYASIREALADAQSDSKVDSALLRISSPGGTVDGLFETLAALEAFSKPISVTATCACSAAYAIAATAGNIEAATAASQFGSVGVAASFFVSDDVVDITSTNAPKKRPDVSTEEGKAVVREYLDAVHDLFVDAIARGRKVTKERVNGNYGRGATLLAGDAQRLGMIDRIAGSKPALKSVKTPQRAASAQEGKTMEDLNTLRAAYPALCAQLEKIGEDRERDRVNAHLTMGKQCGDLQISLKAIADGAAMTQTLMAEYMTVAVNRRDRRLRQEDSDAAGFALDGGVGGGEPQDLGDQVVALLRRERGMGSATR